MQQPCNRQALTVRRDVLQTGNARHFCYDNSFFFFNDTATTEIYTLSLHDALPIFTGPLNVPRNSPAAVVLQDDGGRTDRKSTRLNSSHGYISYAVFCLKKKKPNPEPTLVDHTSLHTHELPAIHAAYSTVSAVAA